MNSKQPNKRTLPQRGTTRRVSNPKVIDEIVLISSDEEDNAPPPAKFKAVDGSTSKAAAPVVSKEVEDRLLADDDIVTTVVTAVRPGRNKSPSLLKGPDISHLLTPQSTEETAPSGSNNEHKSGEDVNATSSPVARLESQPEEDDEVEPIISLETAEQVDGDEEGSVDPLADTVQVNEVEDQGMALSKAEVSVTPSSKLVVPDAAASSSRRIAPTLVAFASPISVKKASADTEDLPDPELELRKFLEEFGKSPKVTPSELKTVEDKMWKAFEKINVKSLSVDSQKITADKIRQLTLSLGTSKVWKIGHEMQALLDSTAANQAENSEEAEKRKRKREVYIAKLEHKLKKIQRLIEKFDQKDVEWDDPDDDVNSAYLTKDRLVKQFMKVYGVLCKAHKCETWTDRPTQKKINTRGVTGYDEISEAVDSYVNSRGGLVIPDFPEILKITKNACKDHQIPLDDETAHQAAKTLFQYIVKTMKKRRLMDLDDVLPDNPRMIEDPAENDPELEEKLKENDKKKRDESEVLKEFTERQIALKEEPQDVAEDEDIEESPKGTDDEEESEDDEDVKSCSDVLDEDGSIKEFTLSSDSNSNDATGNEGGGSSSKAKQASAGSSQKE